MIVYDESAPMAESQWSYLKNRVRDNAATKRYAVQTNGDEECTEK